MGIWETPQAEAAIRLMYVRLLEREPDSAGWQSHVDVLVNQNHTLCEVALGIGRSPEYYDRWVHPYTRLEEWGTPIAAYYRHFLDREPESVQVLQNHANVFVEWRDKPTGDYYSPNQRMYRAHKELVHTFVFSDEYLTKWGYNGVPGIGTVSTGTQHVQYVTQDDWRWCKKCQGLFFAGNTSGVCPDGGHHDKSGSGNYVLINEELLAEGQHGWRWCKKCQGLFFSGRNAGVCPAKGGHDMSGSGDYALAHNQPEAAGQHNWRWCKKCQGLFYAGRNQTVCPAGGSHDMSGSGDYALKSQ